MTYNKMTGLIDLDELEVQAEEVAEVSSGLNYSLNRENRLVCFLAEFH